MTTSVTIDKKLLEDVLRAGQFKSKKEAVETALRFLLQAESQKKLRELKGNIDWVGSLEEMRND